MTDIWLLYATEFFAGMSVMAVELGASRLLAPYFSSSQIVWTIIIGTIMIAMSLGSLYGGKTSVQTQKKGMVPLYRRIAIAGLWIAAIPAVGKYIVLGIGAAVVFFWPVVSISFWRRFFPALFCSSSLFSSWGQ